MRDKTPQTLSVPEAGAKYFGLSRNGAYDAAKRGEIPTIKVGRLLKVPVRALEAKLNACAEAAREEITNA
jgi:excisionase family DNA binding protein